MERSSRSRKAKLGNKENVPPPGGVSQSQSQRQTKSRKRTNSSVLADLPRASKTKKAKRSRKELPPPPTFEDLPYDVLDHLLQFLDVESLTALGRTCSQFDLLINGRYLTTARLPFRKDGTFMKEIKGSEVIEKKPVLRIRCRRVQNWPELTAGKFQLDTHMDLLSLRKVREVDLFPGNIPDASPNYGLIQMWTQCQEFDRYNIFIRNFCTGNWYLRIILHRLSEGGALRHISRLNIMFANRDHGLYIEKIMADMTNLLELNLFVGVNWG